EVFHCSARRLSDLAADALSHLGSSAVSAVIGFLDRASDERQREATWNLLVRLDTAASLHWLRARLGRVTALPTFTHEFLVQVHNTEAAAIAVAALAMKAPHSRSALREVVRKLGSVAVYPFVDVLADTDSSLDDEDEKDLLSRGDSVAPALAKRYSRGEVKVRLRLMHTLAQTTVLSAINLLQADASEPSQLQAAAIAALGSDPTEESRTIVLAAVQSEHSELRAAAARALSQWKACDALVPLEVLAKDTAADVVSE